MDSTETTLHGALLRTAERFPDRKALIFRDLVITYRELLARAEQVAAGLSALGVRRGDRVAIWLPNYPEWIYSALAASLLGAVIVPVNTRYREHEVEYVLSQSGASTLVMTDQFLSNRYSQILYSLCPEVATCAAGELQAQRLPQLRRVIMVSYHRCAGSFRFADVMERGADAAAVAAVRQASAAGQVTDPLYIFWTSGTTSAPKGVMHNHTLASNAADYCRHLDITERDCCLVSMPLFYIAGSMWCFITPLLVGATMVLATEFTPDEVLQLIQECKVSVIVGVPSMYISYLQHPNLERYDRSSLRTGWVGGAPPSAQLVSEIRHRLGVTELVQIYGMTETHGITTVTRRTDSDALTSSRIGVPLPSFRLKVAAVEDGKPVPGETPGELLVGPPRLPMAFVNVSAADRERMFDAEGYFRTGDLVVRHADGYYSLVGRIKDMVKVGGENVASAEVERVLMQHPAVVQAAVLGIPDAKKGEVVAAFVQLRPDAVLGVDELRSWARALMAPFKVPSVIRFLRGPEEWPLTSSGKIKKFELRDRLLAESDSSQ